METKHIIEQAVTWAHHTLLVIGLVSTFIFVRVNWFGKDTSITPVNYSLERGEDPLDIYQEAPRRTARK